MQFKSLSKVSFMTPSVGVFINEDKKEIPYDSTKVHIQTALSEGSEGFGTPYVEYKWGLSDNYHDFVKKYGELGEFQGEITWQNVSTGKSSKLVVVDVKPVTAPQTQPKV